MQQEPDAVDKVLKALARVKTPEGLEARVLARVEQRAFASRDSAVRWQDVLQGSALAGVWWRGAVSGAAVAMLVVGMGAGYALRAASSARRQVVTMDAAARARLQAFEAQAQGEMRPVMERPVVKSQGPCAGEGFRLVPVHSGGATSGMSIASDEPVQGGRFERGPLPEERLERAQFQRPGGVVEGPLTAQERDLMRVARDVGFRELASLNPEVRERVEAEDAAQFQRFFSPPKAVSPGPASAADPTTSEPPPAGPAQTQAPAMEPQPESNTGEKR